MKNYLILIFLFITNISLSQEINSVNLGKQEFTNTTSGRILNIDNKADNEIKGSVFLFENWNTSAFISLNDGKKYKLNGLNYNVIKGQMGYKISEDSIYMINPKILESVSINNKLFKRFLDPEVLKKSFFEVLLINDKFEFLKKYHIRVKKGVYNKLTQQKITPDSYVLKSTYFIKEEDEIKKIFLKKRAFLNFFEDKSEKIKKYVSQNKLSYKKEKDLKSIFNYYYTL
ncbi:hypothetical protein [Abyssalbus ytuae]|uniref:Uncharacterized protein n=1 Tax=Abyssalbus ytuae TaxID=2926907 RepID=A0A9E6ZPK5_9FLAO|nr:hypothetical protein [Abyssalbus ytuae]UOB16413.1 hypothetical protein MQE35_11770 [Abyssalbus ytuae]